MKTTLRFLLILMWPIICLPAYASLTASLDRTQTSIDQPVQLTIISDQAQAAQKLDTGELEKDFKIVGQSSSSQISMVNGSVSTETRISLNLLARREGTLRVPALKLDNDNSEPLTLTVTAAGSPNSAAQQTQADAGVLIETLWEDPGKAYVQGQLNLIVRVYHQGNLLEASLDQPRPENTLVVRIGKDLRGAHSKNGIQYQTIEQRYALFPQKSGTLLVPPVTLQVRVPDTGRQATQRFGFTPFAPGRQLVLQSGTLTKDIAPPATGFSGPTWLPSYGVTLSRSGMPEQAIELGDAINMRIDLSALGLTGAQLPELQIEQSDGAFKVYPDQPTFTDNSIDGKTVKGTRSQTFVLIASRSGMLEIPEIKLAWWDRKQQQQKTARLPALQIEVKASEAKQAATPTGQDQDQPPAPSASDTASEQDSAKPTSKQDLPWKWLSIFAFTGWLLSVVYFLFLHAPGTRKVPAAVLDQPEPDLRPLIRKIRQAAEKNQAEQTWQAIQTYARTRWPKQPPHTPEDWTKRLQSAKVGPLMGDLEACLFAGAQSTNWNGEQLVAELLPALKPTHAGRKNSGETGVPALYPAPGETHT